MMIKSFLFVVLALFGLSQVHAADSLPVKPFKARYDGYVLVGDSPLEMRVKGKLDMALEDQGNGQYRMIYALTGFIGSIKARADGSFHGDDLRPLVYRQTVDSITKSETHMDFNWQQKTLDVTEDQERETLPLKRRVVDPLSLHLLVMWDMQQDQPSQVYTLANGTRLKDYQTEMEGEETLQTPLGNLRTLRVRSSRAKEESDRVTTLWLAPELNYLPVQMVHENDGEETLRMLLQEVEGGGAGR